MKDKILANAKHNTSLPPHEDLVDIKLNSLDELLEVVEYMHPKTRESTYRQLEDLKAEIAMGITFCFWLEDGYLTYER